MACNYDASTWTVLILMIVTGALRSVLVKLSYQKGFEAPLLVTLLYLFGQGLSVFVYQGQKRTMGTETQHRIETSVKQHTDEGHHADEQFMGIPENDTRKSVTFEAIVESEAEKTGEQSTVNQPNGGARKSVTFEAAAESEAEKTGEQSTANQPNGGARKSVTFEAAAESDVKMVENLDVNYLPMEKMIDISHGSTEIQENTVRRKETARRLARIGSVHGLSKKSEDAIMWIHSIPLYLKPLIPAVFNLINSALRWTSLLFISASIAEMLISGLELVLSVVASRLIRKRMVSRKRWQGVGIVILAITGVGFIDMVYATKDEDDVENTGDVGIGILLIVLQCIFSVLQDLAEEIFMQAADFPATLLLGLEGFMGLAIALLLYFLFGEKIGEDPIVTRELLMEDETRIVWIFILPIVFLITGIFNIRATEYTSSMTRNVWKSVRTALVWIFGLVIYYIGGNNDIGEEWLIPKSFYILICFAVLTMGIFVYYWEKSQDCLPEKEQRKLRAVSILENSFTSMRGTSTRGSFDV